MSLFIGNIAGEISQKNSKIYLENTENVKLNIKIYMPL